MSPRAESDALHARVRAFVLAFSSGQSMPEEFDALATDIARFQVRHVAGYRRLCTARGVDPARLTQAAQAPAVPTDAFRVSHVFAFAPEDAAVVFRTSGTSVGARGAHPMRVTETYDQAALSFGSSLLLARTTPPVSVLVLGPSAREAPDSSLAHMTGAFVRRWCAPDVGDGCFFLRGGELDVDGFRRRAARLAPGEPAVVLATSFALVHLLDALDGASVPLPVGSRVMQTGGFKGRSREVDATVLRRAVSTAFHVEERSIIGEYGMTELSSQFWEATIARAGARAGVYAEPPWARVVPVDPETLHPVPRGAIGIARIEDLANVDSAFAVLAQDRVRRVDGGFELLGRAPGAPPRGCSIALDEMLGSGT